MSTQLSLQLSDRIFSSAKDYADVHGFDTLQEFIRELIRERLFERELELFGGFSTYVKIRGEAQSRLAPTPKVD